MFDSIPNNIVTVTDSDDDDDSSSDDVAETTLSDVLDYQTPTSGIVVDHSEDVQFGPRLNYNAPVTINQYVTTSVTSARECRQLALNAPYQGIANDSHRQTSLSDEDDVRAPSELKPDIDVEYSTRKTTPIRRHGKLAAALLVALLLLISVSFLIYIAFTTEITDSVTNRKLSAREEAVSDPVQTPSYVFNRTLIGGYAVFNRSEWGAFPPSETVPLSHPATFVVISQTNSKECDNKEECSKILRTYQGRVSGYIVHSFFVARNGDIYEGKGWDEVNGLAKTSVVLGNETHSSINNIFIAFIGFTGGKRYLSSEQIESTKSLLQLGVELGKLSENYKIVFLGQMIGQVIPEKMVWREVMSWEHYHDKTEKNINISRNIKVMNALQEAVNSSNPKDLLIQLPPFNTRLAIGHSQKNYFLGSK